MSPVPQPIDQELRGALPPDLLAHVEAMDAFAEQVVTTKHPHDGAVLAFCRVMLALLVRIHDKRNEPDGAGDLEALRLELAATQAALAVARPLSRFATFEVVQTKAAEQNRPTKRRIYGIYANGQRVELDELYLLDHDQEIRQLRASLDAAWSALRAAGKLANWSAGFLGTASQRAWAEELARRVEAFEGAQRAFLAIVPASALPASTRPAFVLVTPEAVSRKPSTTVVAREIHRLGGGGSRGVCRWRWYHTAHNRLVAPFTGWYFVPCGSQLVTEVCGPCPSCDHGVAGVASSSVNGKVGV